MNALSQRAGWIVLAGMLMAFNSARAAVDTSTYHHRMGITFSGYMGASTLADFPVLVVLSEGLRNLSFSQFRTPNGGDLRFTDEGQENWLNYEIDQWPTNASAGAAYVWVKIPSLAGASNKIWAYWGNPDAAPPADTSNGATWNANYCGVWHALSPADIQALPDSTAGHYQGTNTVRDGVSVMRAKGQIGEAMNFGGTRDIQIPAAAFSSVTNEITISFWQYGTDGFDNSVFYASRGGAKALNCHLPYASTVYWDTGNDNWANRISQLLQPSDYMGQWNHWVFCKNSLASPSQKIYLNGTLLTSGGGTAEMSGIDSFYLGIYNHESGLCYNGMMDEFRVSNVERSADWIKASYMNQGSNGVFNTYGRVETINTQVETKPFLCNMNIKFAGYTGSETLYDFPVLVVFSNGLSNFSFSQFRSPNGGDLRFTDSGKAEWLSYEVEQWPTNTDTGAAYVWVKLPALTGTNTSIWAFWDNPGATLPVTATNGATWNSGYGGVWHALCETDGTVLPDSTAAANQGSNNTGVSRTAGVIGEGLLFNNNSISLAAAALSAVTNEVTVSFWQYGYSADPNAIFRATASGGNRLHCHLPWGGTVYWFANGDHISQVLQPADYMGRWNHWVLCKNIVASPSQKIYLNGELLTTGTGVNPISGVDNFILGGYDPTSYFYNGKIDEFRVSNVERSADWIKASFMNQGSNSVFTVYGMVQKQIVGTIIRIH